MQSTSTVEEDQADVLGPLFTQFAGKRRMSRALQAFPPLQPLDEQVTEAELQMAMLTALWPVYGLLFPDKSLALDDVRSVLADVPGEFPPPTADQVRVWGETEWGSQWAFELRVLHPGKAKIPFAWNLDVHWCNFAWTMNFYFPQAVGRLLQSQAEGHPQASLLTQVGQQLVEDRRMRFHFTYERYTKQQTPPPEYTKTVTRALALLLLGMNHIPDHIQMMLLVHAVQHDVTPKSFAIDDQYHAFFLQLERSLRYLPPGGCGGMVQQLAGFVSANVCMIQRELMVRPWHSEDELQTLPCIRKANNACNMNMLTDSKTFVERRHQLQEYCAKLSTVAPGTDLRLPVMMLINRREQRDVSLYFLGKHNWPMTSILICWAQQDLVQAAAEFVQRRCATCTSRSYQASLRNFSKQSRKRKASKVLKPSKTKTPKLEFIESQYLQIEHVSITHSQSPRVTAHPSTPSEPNDLSLDATSDPIDLSFGDASNLLIDLDQAFGPSMDEEILDRGILKPPPKQLKLTFRSAQSQQIIDRCSSMLSKLTSLDYQQQLTIIQQTCPPDTVTDILNYVSQ